LRRFGIDAEFIEFLTEVGSDFSLTQGLGGNSSIKSDELMLVKASGKRLVDVESPDYFYEVAVSKGEYSEFNSSQSGKPSIEVFLHAMLKHKYVVHLHSTRGVALSMMAESDKNLKRSLTTQGVQFVKYHQPGIKLKEAIKTEVRSSEIQATRLTILMQNHGTLFGANSVSELREQVLRFERDAAFRLGTGKNTLITPTTLNMVLDRNTIEHIQWHATNNWRISPDHVVFLGINPPQSLLEEITGHCTALEFLQKVIPNSRSLGPQEEQFLWFMNVVHYLPKTKLPTLAESDAGKLIRWEAEKYRVESVSHEK
jgi:ribulose-5-phosphate 4-epimerase/fuculose-1-phosphate aldolase